MFNYRKLLGKAKQMLTNKACIYVTFAVICSTIFGITVANTSKVTIVDEGSEIVCATMRKDVSQILQEAQITVEEHDKVESTTAENGKIKSITISRAFPVTVVCDNTNKTVYMTEGTVQDALQTAQISLGDQDVISKSMGAIVTPNDKIVVNRVEVRQRETTEEIGYETAYTKTPTLRAGVEKVVSRGEVGTRKVVTTEKYIDGVLVSTDTQQQVLSEPVAEEVMVGSVETVSPMDAPDGFELNTDGIPVSYSAVIRGSATAYSARDGAGTASGMRAAVGRVAVNPAVIPYGTKLFIRTTDGSVIYGYAVAADTGEALRAGSCVVDLFFSSYEESCWFGRRNVEIYVLN